MNKKGKCILRTAKEIKEDNSKLSSKKNTIKFRDSEDTQCTTTTGKNVKKIQSANFLSDENENNHMERPTVDS